MINRNSLAVTATGAASAGVTASLPAAAGQYHYISSIQIVRFAAALLTAAAVPVVVTTTNLPGTPAFSFPAEAAAQGTAHVQTLSPRVMLKSINSNTATTIVCPATTDVIWRVNVLYHTEP